MLKVDLRELENFTNALSSPQIDDALNNAFFNSLDDTIAESARKDHAFTNRTGLTEKSIYTEIDGNLGSVFVPVVAESAKVAVPYVEYLVNYDPFLDIAFDSEIRNFVSQFENELREEINELY